VSTRSYDPPFFLPAATPAEAVARIFSLTGAADSGTRGEKRAVLALRSALGLDIEATKTNALMGERIADALGIEWRPSYVDRHRVNLDGLNVLLEAATEAYHEGSLRQLAERRPLLLSGPRWASFDPARSKIEAVNRISMLTGSGPEWLGPGSKEHKRVFVNLAAGLAPWIDGSRLTKPGLAEALALEFGAPWSERCVSTGDTVTLEGLNTVLAGAELYLGRLGADRALLFGTAEEEGAALAAALVDGWRAKEQPDGGRRVVWDARRSIRWMLDQGISEGPNQNEWQGFYYESCGRAILNAAFSPNPTPPRTRFGRTSFDYSLRYVWDLKAHTEFQLTENRLHARAGQPSAPLNDQDAMAECIAEQGLGFLMVGGVGVMDESGEFLAWHRRFKAEQGVVSKPSNSGRSRMRKSAFEPLHVTAFWFENIQALEAAKAAGQLTGFSQGAQAPDNDGDRGRSRRPKYNLNVRKSLGSPVEVARHEWPRSGAPLRVSRR
jgi:hypothetical protein